MKPQIALQLWSIKEACKENFYAALKHVKESGYDGVEFAGYHGKSAAEVKSYLDELNLKVAASHLPYEALQKDLEGTIVFEKGIGNKRLVVPGVSFRTLEEWRNFIDDMERIAKRLTQEGMELYYHNHAHEFTEIPGQDILDYMVNNSKHINLEVDLYWLACSEHDVLPWLEAHKDRVGLFHMKDMHGSSRKSTEVGSGILPIKEYVQVAKQLALPWLIVEQEEFQLYQPLEATAICYRQLEAIVEEVYS